MKENAILSLEKKAMERWRQGDPLGFLEISDESIVYIDPGLVKPIVGLKEFEAFMRLMQGRVNYQGSEFIDPRVVILGDAALLSYNYCSTLLDPDGKITGQTPWNATEVYFRRKSQWRIVHTHWSFVRHKLPPSLVLPLPVQMTRVEDDGLLGELLALESTAMQRWRKGDPLGFIEICAPEVTYFDTATPRRINGREALGAEYAQRAGKIAYDVMDFIDPRVQNCGDLAVLSYRFLSTSLKPDGSVLIRTPWNCTEIYTRSAGRWRILHTHWSYVRGEMI